MNELVGYWPLRGDCLDHSGNGHHGRNHGVHLETGDFDGRDSHIEVPALDLDAGHASAGGYSSQGDDRHVHFGIDDGAAPE